MLCKTCNIKEICQVYDTLKKYSLIVDIEVKDCHHYIQNKTSDFTKTEKQTHIETNAHSASVDQVNQLVESILKNEEEPCYVPSPLKNMPVLSEDSCYICGEPKVGVCSICHKPVCETHLMSQIIPSNDPTQKDTAYEICENCFFEGKVGE